MLVIKCPTCGANTDFSLSDPDYVGPFRCWKCRATFMLTARNENVQSCEPISEEEFESISA